MVDFNKMAKDAADLKIHVSPEGVDEKIVKEDTFLITQTEGGKYRLYNAGRAIDIADTLTEIEKKIHGAMMLKGSVGLDPKRTFQALFGSPNRKGDLDG